MFKKAKCPECGKTVFQLEVDGVTYDKLYEKARKNPVLQELEILLGIPCYIRPDHVCLGKKTMNKGGTMKFKVYEKEVTINTYDVEADTEKAACDKVAKGGGKQIETRDMGASYSATANWGELK